MKKSNTKVAQYILIFLLGWTFFFNVTIKELGPLEAFLKLIDTISEDMIMGAGGGVFIAIFWICCMTIGMFLAQLLSLPDGFARFDNILTSSKTTKETYKKISHN